MAKWTEANTAADLVAAYTSLIKGKVILTTGVTAGSIGAAYVEAVAAAQPALLILAGRSAAKLDEEAANIAAAAKAAGVSPVPTRNLIVDLLSLDSVRKAAAEVNAWNDVPVIDVMHNCAGIMAVPYKLSADGYESQFAANHLSHFLLTNLIMDKILASNSPRIVNVSSGGHRFGPIRWDDLHFDVSEHDEPAPKPVPQRLQAWSTHRTKLLTDVHA
jgi:NAD(P)-dependent dehydrogenase (short-subunit alcohol dehydrogenase family)